MFYHKFYSAVFADKKCTVKRHLHEVIPMTIIAILLMKVMNHINLNEYLFSVTSDYIDPNVAKTSLGVTVTMEITNVGTQGYPGVGKTSVLHLATGKEPAPTRTSTDCVDPPSRYLMIDSATEGGSRKGATCILPLNTIHFRASKRDVTGILNSAVCKRNWPIAKHIIINISRYTAHVLVVVLWWNDARCDHYRGFCERPSSSVECSQPGQGRRE